MSDILNIYEHLKFKSKITFSSEGCLSYIRKQDANEVIFTLSIPYEILVKWHQLKFQKKIPLSFVDLLYHSQRFISSCCCLKPEGIVRLEQRLKELCSSAFYSSVGLSGNKRVKKLQQIKKLAIFRHDLQDVSKILQKIDEIEVEKTQLEEEIKNLEARCNRLLEDVINVKQELLQKQDLEKSMKKIEDQNAELQAYINTLLERDCCQNCYSSYKNKGNTYDQVSYTQKQRKLKELKTNVEQALWFLESFGLKLDNIFLTDLSGNKVSLKYNDSKKSAYQLLSDNDKDKVKSVIYIMDKFCISDAAYHELSIFDQEGLPRSYLIKQCRQELNKLCCITRTPGGWPGAQLSFSKELEHQLLRQMAELGVQMETTQKIKIAGDGAKMSRLTNFVILSFSLLSNGDKVMSSKGIHPIGILSGKEDYNVLQTAGKEIFQEINNLMAAGKMIVNGKEIKLEFYLGGDYKFLLTLLGMNAANSRYSCIYCRIASSERWDMSKPENFYWSNEIARTLSEIKTLSLKTSGDKFGCIHPPLIQIPLPNIVPDELHLLLRITDILEKNIIHSTIRRDKKAELLHKDIAKCIYQNKLLACINKCGVTFSIWRKVDENGNNTEVYDWTSLMGTDKKKLLERLPEYFPDFLPPDTVHTVTKIWKDFHSLYSTISSWSPTEEQIGSFFEKVTQWVNLFLSLAEKEDGYRKTNITPYIHIMCYHVPHFLSTTGVKCFTGQGVEKTNDVIRRLYHQKSNKYDVCKDGLQAVKRMDNLQNFDRTPRKYKRSNTEYWENGIQEERRKRPRISVTPREDDEFCNIDHLTEDELKAKIKAMNIKTRVRNVDKLRQLLKDVIYAAQ